jgi:hypothetical protein
VGDDDKNFDAYRAYLNRLFGYNTPEADLREARQP